MTLFYKYFTCSDFSVAICYFREEVYEVLSTKQLKYTQIIYGSNLIFELIDHLY